MSITLFTGEKQPPRLVDGGVVDVDLRMCDAHSHPLGQVVRGIAFA